MRRLSRLRRGSLHGEDEPLGRDTARGATVEFDVARDLAADDPDAAAKADHNPTSYRDRARLRRRLRYLRRAREFSFRDLGGFVFGAHRFHRDRDDIIAAKLKGLAGMDAELRSLEAALDERRELMLLHEPGVSVCPRCASLHSSDANFCSDCGLPRRGAALPLGPRAPLPVPDAPLASPPHQTPPPSMLPSRSPMPSSPPIPPAVFLPPRPPVPAAPPAPQPADQPTVVAPRAAKPGIRARFGARK